MPLVNVIRGEQVPVSALNVRTPVLRVPLWAALGWQLVKALAWLVKTYVRLWYLTLPATFLTWLYLRYGWQGLAILVGSTAAIGGGWWFAHQTSCLRFGWWPILARYRRFVYRRRWQAAMVTAKLAVSYDRHIVIPVLKRVRCQAGADRVLVRMVTGQIPDDFAKASERLAHTFGVRQVKAIPGPAFGTVVLVLLRGDALHRTIAPLPVAAVPDFTALPMGLCEDGTVYMLRLFGTQVLIVGATGSGKGSVIWSFIRALAAGVSTGLVELWGIDPKGGMELGMGRPLFTRFATHNFAQMAELLEEAAQLAQARAARLAGETRQHQPTQAEPLIVLVIDELANLTHYLTERQLKDRIKAALGIVLSQGRAVGVHVIAAIQDPRKEVLPARGLFPTRIALRLSEAAEVDLVAGDGMRDRGALCDRIPQSQPGVGYVALEGDPTPMRVRFSYLTDKQIKQMARTYGRFRVIEGEATEGGAA
ncbi:S-DNA-T family DNA segregation ATPase FtsK/SpoIIIE [Krasilnikovia cinnamomea]|uniref:S-DNA-T family DNA segregation ATPase FtsK/SpoIIIE n=1 Tax=Krasilnikovia cinnamomea TaxID=349313 RepID=A0A4Q7ZKL2_9ACTN|nr:FtsK/SpoIIIE domain-containing protein [Krasilnikovia cinnamomea]RZU50815.1 S-DNA-T family DNA segregation ATPase FtsK/SpoIIIE [Krasilnikovia cinnamomea]